MPEVNANAKYARRHKLRANGDGELPVDGPHGFRLTVQVMSGAPVVYRRAGSQAFGTLRAGEQVTVAERVIFTTTGPVSIVDVFESDETPVSFRSDDGLTEVAA